MWLRLGVEFELDDPDQFLIQHSLSLFSEKNYDKLGEPNDPIQTSKSKSESYLIVYDCYASN